MRLSGHIKNYKVTLNHGRRYITSHNILKYGDAQIILIEDFPCENRYQLEARERYHIENTKCVNKIIPTRTSKEYHEQNKEKTEKKKDNVLKLTMSRIKKRKASGKSNTLNETKNK